MLWTLRSSLTQREMFRVFRVSLAYFSMLIRRTSWSFSSDVLSAVVNIIESLEVGDGSGEDVIVIAFIACGDDSNAVGVGFLSVIIMSVADFDGVGDRLRCSSLVTTCDRSVSRFCNDVAV